MEPIVLKPLMTRRLVKLAKDARRSPEAMLPFVLRDGFEYCERLIQSVNAGLADAESGRVVLHREAMFEVKRLAVIHQRS